MNKNIFYPIAGIIIIFCCLITSCSTTKYVPEGKYLLNNMNVKIDTKNVNSEELRDYAKQKPNYSKIRLRIYSAAGDTTNWLKRFLKKLGEAPVIYDSRLTSQSIIQLETKMKNKGYLNAHVEAIADTSPQKINLTYKITSREPYRIRNYIIDIKEKDAKRFLEAREKRNRSGLKNGDIFAIEKLEEERQSVSRLFRNTGYYTFTTENLYYLADTTLRSNQVDLTLTLRDSVNMVRYPIHKVRVLSGYDPIFQRGFSPKDSIQYKGLEIVYDNTHFIRPSVLYDNIIIRPGRFYSERSSERTYELISSLSAVNKAGIQYKEIIVNDSTKLNCDIYLTQGNVHGIQLGIDGTNKAGDLGIASNITYNHGNIFNGSENLGIKLRGAYEFISKTSNEDIVNHNYFEVGIGTTLTIPKIVFPFLSHKLKQRFQANTQFGTDFNIQKRPEFIRNFFSLSWKYIWNQTNRNAVLTHSLNFLNVNYVMMPWMSENFKKYLNDETNYLTKTSYENVFTAGIGYNGTYSNINTGRYKERLYTLRYGIETSGNVLQGIFNLADTTKNENGQYQIFGNPFAQYIKADFDFSQTFQLNEKNGIAVHAGMGVAYPYGNSTILPFEKRYYAGGPNNVRGWNTRYLGPGSYKSEDDLNQDITTHSGDINLIFNIEYRYKFIQMFELATFIDAGNIWTIRNYNNQLNGQFKFNSFYKEFALGTGIGLRLDLSFLILRVDVGRKIYDPAEITGNPWVFFQDFGYIKKNNALYFAIGYPF